MKKCLHGDKRAPRGWQDHFETTMLSLGFERLEPEPGCFVKKGSTTKDSIIVVVHVDDLLSVGKARETRQFFRAAVGNVEDQTQRALGEWKLSAVSG